MLQQFHNQLKVENLSISINLKLDKTKSVQFLESVLKKVEDKKEQESAIVLKTEIGFCKLDLNDIETCKKILEEAKKSIDSLGFVDNFVNASYYKVQAEYLKVRNIFFMLMI